LDEMGSVESVPGKPRLFFGRGGGFSEEQCFPRKENQLRGTGEPERGEKEAEKQHEQGTGDTEGTTEQGRRRRTGRGNGGSLLEPQGMASKTRKEGGNLSGRTREHGSDHGSSSGRGAQTEASAHPFKASRRLRGGEPGRSYSGGGLRSRSERTGLRRGTGGRREAEVRPGRGGEEAGRPKAVVARGGK